MLLISWIDFCFPYISYAHLFLFLRAILSIWDFLFLFLTYTLAFMVTQMGKNLIQETQVQSLDWEDSPREGNGNPLQYSCLENPRDRGTWWPAVYGVVQSRIWLKQLSSSSKHTKRRVLAISLKQMLNEYLKIQKARKTHYNVFLYSGFKQ